MSQDQIGGWDERRPVVRRRTAVAVGALAAVLVGLAVAGEARGPGAPDRSSDWIALEAVCPAQTDGRRLLVVRFVVANRSGRDLTVESVQPRLPLGGLQPRSTSTVAGDCHRWVPTAPAAAALAPGSQRVIAMIFRLPARCPSPFPVQARVRVRSGGATRTTDLVVLRDLGGLAFEACPPGPPA